VSRKARERPNTHGMLSVESIEYPLRVRIRELEAEVAAHTLKVTGLAQSLQETRAGLEAALALLAWFMTHNKAGIR